MRDTLAPTSGHAPAAESPPSAVEFRFGRARAALRTADAVFRQRFLRIFADCVEQAGSSASDAPALTLVVDADDAGWVDARLEPSTEAFDPGVVSLLVPELGLVRQPGPDPGRAAYCRSGDAGPVLTVDHGSLRVSTALPWQLLVGHWFVHEAMRRQTGMVFLHGATLSLGGRGVLLCGRKAAGKSTLALALAARGAGFLGDEVAAIDPHSRVCLPFRRAVSMRVGPQSARVAGLMATHAFEPDHLPDGTIRTRAPISTLLPESLCGPVPLTHAFFLDGFAEAPRATPFDFGWTDVARLEPLHAMLGARPAAARAFELLDLLRGVRCHHVAVGGTPDDTAQLIETILEA